MRCSWLLILVIVRDVTGNSENNLAAILGNATDYLGVTEYCGLFLKSIFYDLKIEDQDADRSTKCYDIESTKDSRQVKCYIEPLLGVSDTVERENTIWAFVQKWTPAVDQNATDLETYTYNTTDHPTWKICLPTSCTTDDVSKIFHILFSKEIGDCQIKDTSSTLNYGVIIAIVILSSFIFLMAVSTFYDLYCSTKTIEPLHECLMAFSVHRNGKKIFKTTRSSSELHCLNGIRVLSMTWVIVLHTFSEVCFVHFYTNDDLVKWERTWNSMIIRSGTLAVDSFLAVAGALLVYTFMTKRTKISKENFNIFHHYFHRYIRLTPPLAAAILVSSTLLRDAGSPKNRLVMNSRLSDPCQKHWWSALLYIQNYVNVEDMCLSHSWYLSTDMQLYLISPLILIPLWKKPKIGMAILVLLIPISVIIPFCVAYENKLVGVHGIISHEETIEHYYRYLFEYYFRTHTRATPWFMGMLLGYILFGIKYDNIKKPKIKKVIVLILWATCLVVMVICIFGGHTLYTSSYDRLDNSLFIALMKPAWSLCLGWVIFACALGYGGPINWILSHSVNQILITFTYSMYIIHLPILYVMEYNSDIGRTSFSILNLLGASCNIFVLSLGISVFWVLAFESPMTILEKHLFKR